jgi:hypothetical protein
MTVWQNEPFLLIFVFRIMYLVYYLPVITDSQHLSLLRPASYNLAPSTPLSYPRFAADDLCFCIVLMTTEQILKQFEYIIKTRPYRIMDTFRAVQLSNRRRVQLMSRAYQKIRPDVSVQ